ncbi:hypothetical protein D039_0909A, partial [Vibrio parahaemolyticus EKP-028]
MDAVIPSP